MNSLLTSRVTKAILLALGYLAAVFTVVDLSGSFRVYLASLFNGWFGSWLSASVLLFLVCAALLGLSVWHTPAATQPRFWHIDLLTGAVIAVYAVLSCLYFATHHVLDYYRSFLLLLYTAYVYLIVMAVLCMILVRIRDRRQTGGPTWATSGGTWLRFFRLFTPRRSLGLAVALMLGANLFILLFVFPLLGSSVNLGILIMLFPAFMLVALDYSCRHILSLAAQYQSANEDKIKAERFKTQLITNVSHDIRTPLTSIINYVDLLKALPVEQEEFSGYVDVLDRKSARLKTLIDDLMEASKAGTGNLAVDKGEINLVEIVGQVAGEFEEQFANHGLTLVLPQSDVPVLVQADSRHLWRTLENLFSNVAKYALPKTRVFAEISPCDSGTVFVLRNTSAGPLDVSGDALTEQFIRGDRARQSEGNGLGLYIAKSLMELMDGSLTINTVGDLFEATLIFA